VVVAGKILLKTVKDMYIEDERKLTAKASTIGSNHIKPRRKLATYKQNTKYKIIIIVIIIIT
jgi:hypothetical protein